MIVDMRCSRRDFSSRACHHLSASIRSTPFEQLSPSAGHTGARLPLRKLISFIVFDKVQYRTERNTTRGAD